jgi:hypothetical protein
MRPLSQWELPTRILFVIRDGFRQQTEEHPRCGGSSNHEAVELIESQGSTLPEANDKQTLVTPGGEV